MLYIFYHNIIENNLFTREAKSLFCKGAKSYRNLYIHLSTQALHLAQDLVYSGYIFLFLLNQTGNRLIPFVVENGSEAVECKFYYHGNCGTQRQ